MRTSWTHVWSALAVAGFILAGPAALSAQDAGTVRGSVTSAETGEPIAGATILVIGSARGSLTNPDGRYEINLPAGTYTIRARSIGHQSVEDRVTVVVGESVTVDFSLPVGAVIVSELVAVGSRTARTALETPVPVDVISAAEIREAGQTEVNQILNLVAPSFNASHQTIADGTDHVNPASLRGLGPDQVLVLVNGKRRQQSALVHVNGTFGRGTVGTDLNSIPTAAIERIEVLRDGAAAQYGSDAIAGVINIVLKEQTESFEINAGGGGTGEGDGEQVKVDANYGFPIGAGGYFNVTAEYLDRNRTNRSGPWTGDIFPGITGTAATDAELANRGLTREDFSIKTGMGEATVGNTFYNAAFPLGGNAEFYSFGGFAHRKGFATGFYRLPNSERQVVLQIYPNGFLPEIHTEVVDAAFTGGVRGSHAGWDLDFSLTRGSNSFQYNIENSNNASMGTASPTTFDAGRLSFRQSVGNLDAVRLIDTKGALRSLSLVLGAEFRIENYLIEAGEEASWQLGTGGDSAGVDFDTTSAGEPKDPGSQVFPGFQPANEVDRFRNSIGAYGGLEMQFTDRFLLDVGGRFENYSDFGRTVTGKIATRYEVAPGFALRGAVSNGFRAPSLHQLWFNNVSIQFLIDPGTGELQPARVLTSTNQSQVTKAFGIPDLKEETSLSVSAGLTAQPSENLSITLDGYYITIDDRIVLTSRFASGDADLGTEISNILAPFASQGVGAAQFWANAVDTRTIGADLVATYSRWAGRGFLTLTGSVNLTDTEVEGINLAESVSAAFAGADLDIVRSRIFDREERNRLESALPRQKGSISAKYALERFSVLGRVTYFGKIHYRPTDPALDEEFGAKALFDLDFGYQVLPGARLSFGGSNIFNTFPDPHTNPSNISNNRFIYSRRVTQFGMNGGFYYGRLQLSL